MEKKTVIINVETENGVKELNRLEAKFDEVYGEILPLTGAIGELEDQLYEMAKSGQQGTEEFRILAEEAGRLKKVIAQVDMEVDALSMTTAQKMGGALTGVASGFELVQGTMGAMGVESAKVEEALLKVNSAMAMAQGIQGLKESIPAFRAIGSAAVKAFSSIRGAIISTGLGAIVVALGLVASNWDKIKEKTEKATTSFKNYLESGSTGAKALKWYLDAMVYPITLAVKGFTALKDAIMGTSAASRAVASEQRKMHEKRVEQLARERSMTETTGSATVAAIDREIALRQAAGKTTIDLEKKKQQAIAETAKQMLQQLQDEVKSRLRLGGITEEQAEEYKKLINDNKKAYFDAQQQIKILDIQAQTEKAQMYEENTAKYKEEIEKQKEALKELDEYYKEIGENLKSDAEAIGNQTFNPEILPVDFSAYEESLNEMVEVTGEKFGFMESFAMSYKENFKQNFNSTLDATKTTLDGIAALTEAFTGKSKKAQERAFKINKALNIAQATIDTYKGAVSAYTGMVSSVPGPVGIALGAISAAGVVAMGVANIKKISAQKFEGGSSGGGNVSASTGGDVAAATSNPAQFNIVGNSTSNQIVEGLSSKPQKAYVVASEVTSAQSLDRNRIKTATL